MLDMICFYPLLGSFSSAISVWRNPHGTLDYTIPGPVEGDWASNWQGAGIAHWFLILLFSIVWITWLVRRARRFKRLASEFESASAGSQPAP